MGGASSVHLFGSADDVLLKYLEKHDDARPLLEGFLREAARLDHPDPLQHVAESIVKKRPAAPKKKPQSSVGRVIAHGLDETAAGLAADVETASANLERLRARYKRLRLDTIERYTPSLLESVDEHDRVFAETCASDLAGAQAEILALAAKAPAPPAPLAQAPPFAGAEPRYLATLLAILERAANARPALRAVATRQRRGGRRRPRRRVRAKGISRCLEKVEEGYDGSFLRLLDAAGRAVEGVAASSALRFLVDDGQRASKCTVLRVKDRLTEAWDAEVSGGNRDLLLSVALEGLDDGGPPLICEIQIHLRPLHELKRDLHTLYEAVRVLDAREDHTAASEGDLNDYVLEQAERGIIRKLHSNISNLVAENAPERIAALLTRDPCPLIDVCLGGPTAPRPLKTGRFAGWSLAKLMVNDGAVHCRRLRVLNLFDNGLVGEVPKELGALRELRILTLQRNSLSGSIPAGARGVREKLEVVNVSCNDFEGAVTDVFGAMAQLKILYINNNRLAGPPGRVGGPLMERIDGRANAFSDDDVALWRALPDTLHLRITADDPSWRSGMPRNAVMESHARLDEDDQDDSPRPE
ncbi:oxidoreductase [Aureococcus anophagefferens]|nr:oxidoreductase [Aureococcus anophagefferens]